MMNLAMRHCGKFAAAVAVSCALSACTAVEFGPAVRDAGPPARARIALVDPSISFRAALTEARLDGVACTYELTDSDSIKKLRLRLFDSLAAIPPRPEAGFEPRNKLVFYFADGKVETLVFSQRYANRDAIDAHWQGLYARVANSFPAELGGVVRKARLPQLNPHALRCDFVGQE